MHWVEKRTAVKARARLRFPRRAVLKLFQAPEPHRADAFAQTRRASRLAFFKNAPNFKKGITLNVAHRDFVKTQGILAQARTNRGIERTIKTMLMPPKEIKTLQDVIQAMHGCESIYRKTVHVRDRFQGRTAWDGLVKVFKLVGHPKAKRCYAWSYRIGKETKSTAVLEIPPVDSPESAVKVAMAP